MDYHKIRHRVLEVFCKSKIRSFPVDCFEALSCYGYRTISYSRIREVNYPLYEICTKYSQDAFRDGNSKMIVYNDSMPLERVRFSLAHELGHIVLGHYGDRQRFEQEANYFASCLLAPRAVMDLLPALSPPDISLIFGLSGQAALIAAEDYLTWKARRTGSGRLPETDSKLQDLFYDPDLGIHVWHRSICPHCGREQINRLGCSGCRKIQQLRSRLHHPQPEDENFKAAQDSYLYGEE